MSRGTWFALGLAIGIQGTVAAVAYLAHLEDQAKKSVREPGSLVLRINHGKQAESDINLHRRTTGRAAL